ncbi:hypothetical protein HY045_03760 [Candidatus Woesebacteria bacterium]|nr:hypothetical protein [Candidatus Woesebacteria bacterium]
MNNDTQTTNTAFPATKPAVPVTPVAVNVATDTQKPQVVSPLVAYTQGTMSLQDLLAPNSIEVDFDFIKVNGVYFRTIFVAGYPRFVSAGWLEPIINFDSSLDTSFYIYPVEAKTVLDDLRRKIAEMEAEMATDMEQGKIVDPSTQAKLEDARVLQEQLVKGSERFYEFAFYITIPAPNLEDLNQLTKQVESTLGSLLVVAKHATLDMKEGFLSTAPFGVDRLNINRNMDTTSLSTTFPLTSAELSSDRGVLYGINSQNGSFVIFDRYSMENANMVIFGTSGGGKCTSHDTTLLFKEHGSPTRLDKIGEVVDKIISKRGARKFDKESEGVISPGLKVFTYNNNMKGQWTNVTAASRKISPKNLLRIKTDSGRTIEVTGEHSLVIFKDGSLQTIKGNEIRRGMYVPLPRKIGNIPNVIKFINLYRLLGKFGVKKIIKNNVERVYLKTGIKKTSLPKNFPINRNFSEILGYIVSEGMLLPKRTLISTTSRAVQQSAERFFKSIDLPYSFTTKKGGRIGIYVSSVTFAKFVQAVGLTGKSHQKRIPSFLFSAPNTICSSFLSGYFEGDGGVDGCKITATTKSKSLSSDLTYLLLRFGIIARIKETKKAAANTSLKTKRKYYKVSISGQENIRNFIKRVGFVSKEKNLKANGLLKKGNTNVDIVPEIGCIFDEIHNELYSYSETSAPKKFSEIKLGIFKPSRKNLLQLISKIEERVIEIESLEKDGLSTLRKLPSLNEIIKKGHDKKKNKLLWKQLGHSWQTIRAGTSPYLSNALQAYEITHEQKIDSEEVTGAIYRSFNKTGESLRNFDNSLWQSVVIGKNNPEYNRVLRARDFISNRYELKKKRLSVVKQKIDWLRTLVNSDLFWDPIVSIEKIKAKHKYVYDLQVKNQVFLAGHGGLFIHNSYFVKLEAMRSLMLGTQVLILDPEEEYRPLAEAAGGEYISFSYTSPSKINPFDLSQIYDPNENQLGLKILSLHSLFKVVMGAVTPVQEALLDRALVATYRAKGITQDPATQAKEPPLMEDLYKALIGMEVPDALDLASRIEKFVRGSFVGIFDKQTNIKIDSPFIVFSVKDLPEILRPIAMFVILDFIWTRVKKDLKKRVLIVEEAWQMMKYPDTAQFLWSVVKRARKYYLGLTTITQDVEDFLSQDIGKAIVTNSALQLLLKQSPAAIDKIGEVFYLSQGEKQLLLAANVGEGVFFAGPHHAPIRIVASEEEHRLITTKPQEVQIKQQTGQ